MSVLTAMLKRQQRQGKLTTPRQLLRILFTTYTGLQATVMIPAQSTLGSHQSPKVS